MKTLLVTFDSEDDYNQFKQIKKIVETIDSGDLLIAESYDDLDKYVLNNDKEYQKLIVLHENSLQFEDFEKAVKTEYHRFFEEIEVVPELFYRQRLIENNNLEPAIFIIYPWNAPIIGSAEICKNFKQTFANNNFIGVSYCPLNSFKYLWCTSLDGIAKRFNGIPTDQKPNNVTFLSFTQGIQYFNGKQATVLYPDYLQNYIQQDLVNQKTEAYGIEMLSFRNAAKSELNPGNPIFGQLSSLGNKAPDFGKASEAFTLGQEINKYLEQPKKARKPIEKTNKEAMEAIQLWVGNENQKYKDNKMFAKRKFLMECLSMIASFNELKEPVIPDERWRQFRKRLWSRLGIDETLKTVDENVSNLGGGLLVDLKNTVLDAVKTATDKKEKEKNKEQPIELYLVTHPKWQQFANCFDGADSYQSLKEDEAEQTIHLGIVEQEDESGKNI